MDGVVGRPAVLVAFAALAVAWFASCKGEARTITVTAERPRGTARPKAFAFSEMKEQARRTCSSVPRELLAKRFAKRSSDYPRAKIRVATTTTDRLLYVEDIDTYASEIAGTPSRCAADTWGPWLRRCRNF